MECVSSKHEDKLGRSELVTEFGDSCSLTPTLGDIHSVELLEQAEVCVAVSLTQEVSRDCVCCVCAASLRLSLCESSVRGDTGKESVSLPLVCVCVAPVCCVLVPVLTVVGLYRGICRNAVITLSPRFGVSHSDSVSYSMFAGSGEGKVTSSWSKDPHTHTHTLGHAVQVWEDRQGHRGRQGPHWGPIQLCLEGGEGGESHWESGRLPQQMVRGEPAMWVTRLDTDWTWLHSDGVSSSSNM